MPHPLPMKTYKKEYIWEINDGYIIGFLKHDKEVKSPSFFGGPKRSLEWQLQLWMEPTYYPQSWEQFKRPSDKVDHLSILLKLVSMKGPEAGEQAVTNISVCYDFEFRFANSVVTKSNKMERPERFSVGDTHGVKSFCTMDHFKRNCHSPFLGTECMVKVYCAVWRQDHIGRMSAGEVLDDYVATRQFQSLTTFMRSLLNDSSSADITVKVGSETFYAHKNILSARSKVFAAMFGSDMMEARNRTVVIQDFEPQTVQAMLRYIYCGDITAAKERYFELLKIADKYELLELREECEKFIVPSLTVGNAAESLKFAKEHDLRLRPEIEDFINRNRAAVLETKSFKDMVEQDPKILIDLYLSDQETNE